MPKKSVLVERGGFCNCGNLRKATRRVSQLYDTALAPSGLKVTQLSVLAHVGRLEPVSIGDLASSLVMDAGALAHTLKPLMREGYLSTAPDPADRRARLVRLTAQGHVKVNEATARWLHAQHAFEAAFGRKRARALRTALGVLSSDDFESAFATAIAKASL